MRARVHSCAEGTRAEAVSRLGTQAAKFGFLSGSAILLNMGNWNRLDPTGQTHGSWECLGREGSNPKGVPTWRFRCVCGKEAVKEASRVVSGATKHCGCLTGDIIRAKNDAKAHDRFWSKVNKTDGCWEWTASRDKAGYGYCSPTRYGSKFAHRASWQIHNGTIPDGLCVCHQCDNPSCVRPDHLFLGTVGENNADRNAKGRSVSKETHPEMWYTGPGSICDRRAEKTRGEASHFAKLTEAQVVEIKTRLAKRNGAALAREFGVEPETIRLIRLGKTWRHVPWVSNPTPVPVHSSLEVVDRAGGQVAGVVHVPDAEVVEGPVRARDPR